MRRWLSAHPCWALALAALAALVPFLGKPFNMDDPLFVWTARHIQAHPGSPYGFGVNWFGTVTPMWEATKNPPLASYYLAIAGAAMGWGEVVIHLAGLLPAIAVIVGTYRLARHFCQRPALAALLTLVTPVFLVSSTTVMCDVPMLALWVWAAVLWVEGTERNGLWKLPVAGLVISLAILTKYYGAVLIPLLAAYTLIAKRRLGWWIACLALPLAALCAYGFATRALYGRALPLDAVDYAKMPQGLHELFSAKAGGLLTTLTFTGGGFAVAAFFAPLLWRPRVLEVLGGATLLFGAALLLGGVVLKDYGPIQGSSRWFIEAQILAWTAGGVCVLVMAVADVWEHRDAGSWLLALWVLGTFLFAAEINWTVNGRSLMPMAPAVGILLARRLERNAKAGRQTSPRAVSICLAAGATLALLVTRADFLFAKAVRESARNTFVKYGRGPERFWFQGHWGFQYYMEQSGASALDRDRTELKRGDIIAVPENNTNLLPIRPELALLKEIITVPGPSFLTTARGEVGASFYASLRGPLPFAFGAVPPELVAVLVLEPPAAPTKEN